MLNHIYIKGEGISEKAFTLDVKIYFPIKIFLTLSWPATAGKKGEPGRTAEMIWDRGSFADP
ncbi:hypothetical protein C0033_06600 [Clostridium sp. chh4-2]|nr:hypothetical protein C0033_06600 [Clostridium sp. chh4-2]